MCGFVVLAGQLSEWSSSKAELLISMLSEVRQRGPDSLGTSEFKDVLLGHRRLTIIDVDGGHQPMNIDPDYELVYNGEIYNALELRQRLASQGVEFKTDHSDTEVLYNGLIHQGDRFLEYINGIYSFCFLDKKKRQIITSIDHAGIKPAYIYNGKDFIAIASQPKAFIPLGLNPNNNLRDWGVEYFRDRSAYNIANLYPNVARLNKAYVYKINIDSLAVKRIKKDRDIDNRCWFKGKRSVKSLIKLMEEVVSDQLLSDVPVGIYLSGGVDSSILAAISNRYGCQDAFTVSSHTLKDEIPYAQAVANRLNINHHILDINKIDICKIFDEWVDFNDDPVSDPSALALYALSQLAYRKGFKVMLAGDGADELFGGYNAYKRYNFARFTRALMPEYVRLKLAAIIKDKRLFDYYLQTSMSFLGSAHAIDYEISKILFHKQEAISHLSQQNSISKGFEIDLDIRLPNDILNRTDRATMAASVECRVPFLDRRVCIFAEKLKFSQKFGTLGAEQKKILKTAALRLNIPRECIYRSKIGFELPVKKWLTEEFSARIYKYIGEKHLQGINYDSVYDIYQGLASSDESSHAIAPIWAWFTLESWSRKFAQS